LLNEAFFVLRARIERKHSRHRHNIKGNYWPSRRCSLECGGTGIRFQVCFSYGSYGGPYITESFKNFRETKNKLGDCEKTVEELLEHLLKEETERSVRRVGIRISHFVEEKGQKQLTDFVNIHK